MAATPPRAQRRESVAHYTLAARTHARPRMDDRNPHWDHGLDYAVRTDIGLRRTNNQDALAAVVASSESIWRQRGHLFVVADGMGAHAAGELASKLAVDNIPHRYHKLVEEPPPVAIRKAIEQANAEIHGRGQANLDFHGMGTTSSCLLLTPAGAYVAQVGDSRVYRLRGNRLEQLSFDHSLVWELIASGQLRDKEAANAFPKNIITRSLGPNAQVQVDLEGPFPIEVGDTFLLCSDGLSGQLNDEELAVLLECLPPADVVNALVDVANLRGGPDNITVVVARVTGAHITRHGEAAQSAGGVVAPARGGSDARLWLWTVTGVLAAVALLLLAVGQWLAGLFPAAGALVMAAVAWRLRRGRTRSEPGRTGMLGRAPYASCVSRPDSRFVEQLANVFQQLREAATTEDWAIDWSRVINYSRQAAAATQAQSYAQAVREYCHAISFMMNELRAQRKKKGG